MLTAIIFVIILGVLIFVHELGHFLIARRNGIRVEEFGFGFPPRILGFYKNNATGKAEIVRGNKTVDAVNTVYSVNLIPLGGFVRIKGEDGLGENEKDSFASCGAWVKIKILASGVLMNFVLAWALFSLTFMIGSPEAIEAAGGSPDSKIQVSEVLPDAPAEIMGLRAGDEIIKNDQFQSVEDLQKYIQEHKGFELVLQVRRGKQILELKGTPRTSFPEGQGPLGIRLVETRIVSYPWYEAIWKGLLEVFSLIVVMLAALFGIIKNLIYGREALVEVAGPVGIAVMTKQFATLGLVYLLRFTALLSVNLGIINSFPFPALDGGRILFVIIGKIKGSPIARRTEQAFNTVGFILLIMLMIYITFRDVDKIIIK